MACKNDRHETACFTRLDFLLAQLPLPVIEPRSYDTFIPAKLLYMQPARLIAGVDIFKLFLVPHRFFAHKNRTDTTGIKDGLDRILTIHFWVIDIIFRNQAYPTKFSKKGQDSGRGGQDKTEFALLYTYSEALSPTGFTHGSSVIIINVLFQYN